MKASTLFKKRKKPRILIVGDLILDHYIWGLVDRISPEAPVPVVDVLGENYALGGAANVADNIVKLGGTATVVGVRGDDPYGKTLESLLHEKKIDTSGLYVGRRPTTVKTRVIAHGQQVVRFDREEKRKLNDRLFRKILDFMHSARDGWDGIIVSDYKKGVITEKLMKFIVQGFKKKGFFVSVDPKVGHMHLYKGVSLITPNLNEASEGSRIDIRNEKSLLKAGMHLLRKLRCDAVLITRGEQGMSLFMKETVVHIPTVAQNVFDVTGAGDTVIAGMTFAHIAGANLHDAALIANHAAGVVVGQVGTATATPAQIIQSIKETH
jgi:D-beta-D-heptose 7-phosphate kinase/D-beta-D-heptose 1-phosphate adenosyltransferase